MLRVSRAETTEGRLENVQKLIQFAGSFTGALCEWRHASSEEQKKVLASSSRNMSCHGHRPPPQGDVAALPRGTRALATVPARRRHDRTSVN